MSTPEKLGSQVDQILNWKCALSRQKHDVFISYRAATEEHVATALHSALSVAHLTGRAIHPYLDRLCIPKSTDWPREFVNGLLSSQIITILISKDGLEKAKRAHIEPDNFFLEIQLAMLQKISSTNTGRPVVVQPVFMFTKQTIDNDEVFRSFQPNPREFPEELPCHPDSPLFDGKRWSIRQTIQQILTIQSLHATNAQNLVLLAPHFLQLCSRAEVASRPMSFYDVQEHIFLTAAEDTQLRVLLEPVDSNPDRRVLEALYVKDTRQWLLDHVADWVNQKNDDRVLWLSAIAGVGKSVAAAQIANMLQSRDQLATSIFLKYNDTRKNNPRILLTTIAYGLCKWYAPIGRRLLASGLTKSDIANRTIPELFKALVENPLYALSKYQPRGAVVVMVDGLDECHPRDEILSLLAGGLHQLQSHKSWLKLLLTSRPEVDIKTAFRDVPTKTIEPSSADNIRDLRVFINHRLRNHVNLSDRDRAEAIEVLLNEPAQATYDPNKTFVWVNLVLNTLEQDAGRDALTLTQIREAVANPGDLKALYQRTFENIYTHCPHQSQLVVVISALATAQSILTPKILADIFFWDISRNDALAVINKCLTALSLLLDWCGDTAQDDATVRFNHKSVPDYLLGDGSRGEIWHVRSRFHLTFAARCLLQITRSRHTINICDIYDFHDRIPDFEDRVKDKITPTLRYSVAHWITHFVWLFNETEEAPPQSPKLSAHTSKTSTSTKGIWTEYQSSTLIGFDSTGSGDVSTLLPKFLSSHVLFWLECGSLTRVTRYLIGQLGNLRLLVARAPSTLVDDSTKTLVTDTYRFIREFADPIIASAPQVYNSGFAFMPKGTLLYKTYADRLEESIPFLVTTGPAPGWDPCEVVLSEHRNGVNAVALTPDGHTIVSGSGDRTIKVWDSITGQNKLTLKGHEGPVNSVCVSADGKQIVSGSNDNTVKIWDVVGGRLRSTLQGHTGWVTSVAISRSGRWVVSGSKDKTIRVWDTSVDQLKYCIEEHDDTVNAVTLTADEKHIVSVSQDQTICVWDLQSGQSRQKIHYPKDPLRSVAVSGDGKLIVAGSSNGNIGVWLLATGRLTKELSGHSGSVECVAVARDNRTIVSGSRDHTIRLWDVATDQHSRMLTGHAQTVKSVAISSDGAMVVSGSWDKTIRIWDSDSTRANPAVREHRNAVRSFVTSEDDRVLVSASTDKGVMIWDAITGQHKHTLENHTGAVNVTAVSRDCRVVVSGSNDKTVMVWDAVTGQLKQTLEGHATNIKSVWIAPNRRTIVSEDVEGQSITWALKKGEFERTASTSDISPKSDGKLPLESEGWSAVSGALPQWIRHGDHMLKVPHACFGWDGRQTSSLGTLRMWTRDSPCRLVAIHPVHRRDMHSEYVMAYFYQNCSDSSNRQAKALRLLRSSAKKGFDGAKVRLGAYLTRLSQNQDHAHEIFNSYLDAARNLHPDAQFHLANCYELGLGVVPSISTALKLYADAANNGHHKASMWVARYCERDRNPRLSLGRALGWYQRAADLWYPEAEYKLGQFYETGQDVAMDLSVALYWYQKAAKQGHVLAQHALGQIYEKGTGVGGADLLLALEWFTFAAKQNHEPSKQASLRLWTLLANQGSSEFQLKLAEIYEHGTSVPRDLGAAFSWYSKAAENSPEGLYHLGRCYSTGVGCQPNPSLAFDYYRQAADRGHTEGRYNTARCYEDGLGTDKNQNEAMVHYEQAALQGHKRACHDLGRCFENAIGTVKDPIKAFTWYQKAADMGVAESIWHVGRCHERGIGTTQDHQAAFKRYRDAAKSGNHSAMLDLGRCHEQGLGTVMDQEAALKCYHCAIESNVAGAQEAYQALQRALNPEHPAAQPQAPLESPKSSPETYYTCSIQ